MGAAGNLPSDPDRNMALELVRVTEAAAIAAGRPVIASRVGGLGEQLADRERRLRRAQVGAAFLVEPVEDLDSGEVRHEFARRLVESDDAAFDELHHRRTGHGEGW